MINLHHYIEHTLLSPTATTNDILQLCNEAEQHNFYGVCVNSGFVYLAANALKSHQAKVISTIGFPLGSASTKSKVEEAKQAVKDGADEIDMVLNLGFLKSSLTKSVREEISAVKNIIGDRVLKVIIETSALSPEEIQLASAIVKAAGADFVKSSTGFGSRGATVEDITTIKRSVEESLGIKASGGIKTAQKAVELIKAGATRIGTSYGIALLYDPENHIA